MVRRAHRVNRVILASRAPKVCPVSRGKTGFPVSLGRKGRRVRKESPVKKEFRAFLARRVPPERPDPAGATAKRETLAQKEKLASKARKAQLESLDPRVHEDRPVST